MITLEHTDWILTPLEMTLMVVCSLSILALAVITARLLKQRQNFDALLQRFREESRIQQRNHYGLGKRLMMLEKQWVNQQLPGSAINSSPASGRDEKGTGKRSTKAIQRNAKTISQAEKNSDLAWQKAVKLAQQGLPPEAIAGQSGVSKAEAELLFTLHHKRRQHQLQASAR